MTTNNVAPGAHGLQSHVSDSLDDAALVDFAHLVNFLQH